MDRLFTMTFNSRVQYDIKRITGICDPGNAVLADHIPYRRAFCLVDNNLNQYSEKLKIYLNSYNIEAFIFHLSISEQEKNLESIVDFTSFCFKNHISRRDTIIALGGGITCDLAGLCSNLLRRGAPCIKIPTTLLGMIDAAIGIKNGINYAGSKNSLGTFYPPEVVFIDLSFLQTLASKEIKNGLVEMIKIISLKDHDSWVLLKKNINKFLAKDFESETTELIDRSIAYMVDELGNNLYEANLMRIVDYGHEFGHLIEILTEHELSHGEAVGIGMLMSNHIALRKGLMKNSHYDDFLEVYNHLKLPFWHSSLSAYNIYEKLYNIRNHKGGKLNIVALQEIGSPIFINELSFEDIEQAANFLISADTAFILPKNS